MSIMSLVSKEKRTIQSKHDHYHDSIMHIVYNNLFLLLVFLFITNVNSFSITSSVITHHLHLRVENDNINSIRHKALYKSFSWTKIYSSYSSNNNNETEESSSIPSSLSSSSISPRPKVKRVQRVVTTSNPMPNLKTTTTLKQFQSVVQNNQDKLIVVRFYATWCKACMAITPSFYRLVRRYPSVTFIEVPISNDNLDLHQSLGIVAIPYGHIYHPDFHSSTSVASCTLLGRDIGSKLVEEMKMNKQNWNKFEKVVDCYVQGRCDVLLSDNEEEEGDDALAANGSRSKYLVSEDSDELLF